MKKAAALLPLLLLLTAPSSATTLTFDEFGSSPLVNVDGLHAFGLTFHFTGGTADYNAAIGTSGAAVLVTDPLLSGPTTGTLTLDFDVATPTLDFDVVLLSFDTLSSGYTVTLDGGASSPQTTAPQPGGLFSEGAFHYAGTAISSASITFFSGLDSFGGSVNAFGLDNLSFDPPGETPEPATWFLLTGGLLAFATLRQRQAR